MHKNIGIKEPYIPDYQLLGCHGQVKILADLQS